MIKENQKIKIKKDKLDDFDFRIAYFKCFSTQGKIIQKS